MKDPQGCEDATPVQGEATQSSSPDQPCFAS